MVEKSTNMDTITNLYYPSVRIIEDIVPFFVDISVLVRAKFKSGLNSFIQEGRKIDILFSEMGYRGWIVDREKGSYPVVYSNTQCLDLYPGWNLLIIKNKEIELFLKNRFIVDSKGQFMEITLIKQNKAFLDTTNNAVYKSAWVMVKKGLDLLPFYVRDKYLVNNELFMIESQEKVIIVLGDQGRGYYRYSFIKESVNNSFWIYSFAKFDQLGYKLDEKKRCLTDISPECYLRFKRKFIIFDDPLLTCIIKFQIGISGRGLLPSDLISLRELDLEGYLLHSIHGIEQCLGIQTLKIRGHYVSGLAEIALALPSLNKIYLSKELYSVEELKILASFL